MNIIKDFWVTPEYSDLLAISQKHLHAFIVEDRFSAEDTLDRIAQEMENIFEFAGYYKE